MSKPFPAPWGSRLHRMNPDDAPSTPPEPPKEVRSITPVMWVAIIFTAFDLVELAAELQARAAGMDVAIR